MTTRHSPYTARITHNPNPALPPVAVTVGAGLTPPQLSLTLTAIERFIRQTTGYDMYVDTTKPTNPTTFPLRMMNEY